MKAVTYILLSIITFLFYGCEKDPTPPATYNKCAGVFICNEGNFTYGNASLSFYDPSSKEIFNQIFYNANSFPLGDVCQSMVIKDGKGYVVLNNSGKIVVIDVNTFKYIGTISELISPRYIEFLSENKAYVTDLYSPYITIFNPSTFKTDGQVYVGFGTEQLIKYKNYVFVTSWSFNDKVYQIDYTSDEVKGYLNVTKQPNSIVIDKFNKLWVLSDGGYEGSPYGHEIGALTKIDAETFSIENVFKFPNMNSSPSELKINGTGDTLFFIFGVWGVSENPENGVYKMAISDVSIPEKPFIKGSGHLFYSLGIDPYSSDIYVSDAIDFMQNGIVYRYGFNGIPKDYFKTNINPKFFCFKK